jgi:hypothetical protein
MATLMGAKAVTQRATVPMVTLLDLVSVGPVQVRIMRPVRALSTGVGEEVAALVVKPLALRCIIQRLTPLADLLEF